MNQETLEQAAELHANSLNVGGVQWYAVRNSFIAGANWKAQQLTGMKEERWANECVDLQDQVRQHIKEHDLFDWHEALTEEEMIYLENLLLTFFPLCPPGSIGYEKARKFYDALLPTPGMTVYVPTPIKELPEKTGWYYVMNPNKEIMPRMLQFIEGKDSFENPMQLNISYWLKPLSIPDINELVRERDELKGLIQQLIKNPYGCPMCDSGVFRDKSKEHWDDCLFKKTNNIL